MNKIHWNPLSHLTLLRIHQREFTQGQNAATIHTLLFTILSVLVQLSDTFLFTYVQQMKTNSEFSLVLF
jgi:hypothetical protein